MKPPPPPPRPASAASGAKAFATGSGIQLGSHRTGGSNLMAHEASHVVQQGSAPSAIPANHTLQTKGMSSQGAKEAANGALPANSADRAVLRSMTGNPPPPPKSAASSASGGNPPPPPPLPRSK